MSFVIFNNSVHFMIFYCNSYKIMKNDICMHIIVTLCIVCVHCFFYNIDYYVDKYNVQCTHVIESEKCIFIKLQCQYDVAIEKAWHKKFVNYLLKKMFKKMRRSYKKNINTFFIFHSWLNWKFLVHKQPLSCIITFPSIQSHLLKY